MCYEEIYIEEDSDSYESHHHHCRGGRSKKGKRRRKKKKWRFPNMTTVVKPKQGAADADVAMDESKLPTGAGVPSLMPVENQSRTNKDPIEAKPTANDKDYGTLKGIYTDVFQKGA
ncbi:hypothetical protein D918_05899 [Trichuris suis]|nr:hypothetical protein D918_05899 [Trichuris suis]